MRKGKHSIILCGALVKAVRIESVEAVSYHWNVSRALVQKWRQALGVQEFNPGTKQLRAIAENVSRPYKHLRALQRWSHPETLLPRPMPQRLLRRPKASDAMKAIFARTGRHPDPDLKLWTHSEEKLLGTATDEEISTKLKRTLAAVRARRNLLGIRSFVGKYIRPWTKVEERLLGTKTDREVANLLRRSPGCVRQRRFELRIENSHPAKPSWKPQEDRLLGSRSDNDVARLTGRTRSGVVQRRILLGIPLKQPKLRPWTADELRQLGKAPDAEVARSTGRTLKAVKLKRFKMRLRTPSDKVRQEYG